MDFQAWIALDRAADEPLYRQLYLSVQQLILSGRLAAGSKLPSIRTWSATLGVSRNTVVNALDQLNVEGYLEAKVGAGTFVSRVLPESHLQVDTTSGQSQPRRGRPGRLSSRGQALKNLMAEYPIRPRFVSPVGAFSLDGPDLDDFPWDTWRRLSGRLSRRARHGLLGYQRDLGLPRLREMLAEHLALARGLRCSADQILMVSGSQEALFLAAQTLLDPGDEAWVESPGYLGTLRALTAAGARSNPIPVDKDGIDVAWARHHHPHAKLACVTPSHQFPLGPTLSLGRRLELLAWADARSSWVLEDDYDSEYRYEGRPLQALQGLDGGERVVYAGTFSKVLFPGLRLGYLVAPPNLIQALAAARTAVDLHPPALTQAILAEFFGGGYYWRHVRRMRGIYADRCKTLVEALQDHMGPGLELGPHEAGMHLVLWLPEGMSDRAVSQAAAQRQVECLPVSAYDQRRPRRGGLVLGFGRLALDQIRPAVRRLTEAIDAA